MRRREFIGVLGGSAIWPQAIMAASTDQVRRIGVLMMYAAGDPEGGPRLWEFTQALKEFGWIEGQNVWIDSQWGAAEIGRLGDLAKALVDQRPDVLVANSTPALMALRQAARAIPIVFTTVSDPVGQGFVRSLARPGGTITGFTLFEFSLGTKWLEVLKEIAPNLSRVAIMFNPETAPYYRWYLGSFEAAATQFKVEPIPTPVHSVSEIERQIRTLGGNPGGSLIAMSDAYLVVHREQIIELAARYRLPTMYPDRHFAKGGGLISYGVDEFDVFRRAASYIDRILRGADPGNLPIQQPSKFELVINLKTAKDLGLKIPPSLLARADEVIE